MAAPLAHCGSAGALQCHSRRLAHQSRQPLRLQQHAACAQQQQQQQQQAPPPAAAAWWRAGAAVAAALVLQASAMAGGAQAGIAVGAACLSSQQQELHQQVLQQPQQPQQQQHQASPLAELAGLFGGGSGDAPDPFTLYGSTFKQYQVEQLDGEKVVSRSRGFTVDSCVSALAAAEETPAFNGLATGEKVRAGDGLLCKRAVGPDLKPACKQSCTSACSSALDAYEQRLFAETGFKLEPKERERVLRNCRHSCAYECGKSGKAHDFVVPSRR